MVNVQLLAAAFSAMTNKAKIPPLVLASGLKILVKELEPDCHAARQRIK